MYSAERNYGNKKFCSLKKKKDMACFLCGLANCEECALALKQQSGIRNRTTMIFRES